MCGDSLTVRVECYAGHRGEQTPRRFFVEPRWVEVLDVVDAWLAPDHRYFKVVGDDGRTCILRHDPEEDRWELTLAAQEERSARGEGEPAEPPK